MTAPANIVRSWTCILFVSALAITGECLIAAAMRRLGDLDRLRTRRGLLGYLGPIRAVLSSPIFLIGALCMALNFFAMLFTLSIVDLSLAAPAIGSLTYVGNAIAAKLFLHENVDRRRWLATSFLAIGVVLVSR
ncbi:MAG TPA: EamA family transporter [Candidatus Aquilonibacter sp.]|nr:EamA family transporter [Candidatus Aquilonibacter sp.]